MTRFLFIGLLFAISIQFPLHAQEKKAPPKYYTNGLGMKFVMHVDVVSVKAFFLGLMRFEVLPLPTHPGLYLHLGMVVLLMVVFPVSKLLHAPGVFFSPTRNQVDNPRETRHLAPWAAQLESK